MRKKFVTVLACIIPVPVLLLTALCIYHQIRLEKERSIINHTLGQFVEVDGHNMNIYTEGSGNKTLVFLSGFGTPSPVLDFKPLMWYHFGVHPGRLQERRASAVALNLEAQKQEFLTICRSSIQREGLEDLIDWLCKADFFTAPASTKYHGGYAGGLCQHSIDVYQYAKKISFLMPKEPSEESLAIATLFHDLCKVNLYKVDKRNQKINGEWQEVPYYIIDEKFHFGGHGSKSVFLIQQFMKLTTEEAAAINCHMGFSDGSATTVRDVSNAYQQFPLAWITHVADEAATYLLER